MRWIPRGLQNLFEMIIEALYGLAESILGKRARQVFWLGATIFLFVLFANWMELLPGVDSIGVFEHPHEPGIAHSRNGALLWRCPKSRTKRSRPRPSLPKARTPRRNTKAGN